MDPRAPCSPPRQGSPALSHAHAIWVIWSSHYHARTIPVGCHSDNTPSGSSRGSHWEEPVGFPQCRHSWGCSSRSHAWVCSTTGRRSAWLCCQAQIALYCLRFCLWFKSAAKVLVSSLPCWIKVCIVKGWMDVLPTRYALLSRSHSIWLLEMTLSFKENSKKQPKYVSDSDTYILESEKKKNSCLVDTGVWRWFDAV